MSRIARSLSTLVLAGGLALSGAAAKAGENVMVVFDGSNSMWGQIDGVAKIEIARGVMENLLGDWTEDRKVGLMAYGHRRRGDCTDIETLVQPGEAARDDILARIGAITPTGKTPLSDAVEQAAVALSYTDEPATVVLISDGLESCDRDPCALAEALEKAGVNFTAHVVGFGLGGDADTASLACIAEKTGGQFISASNADELGAALSTVGSAVAAAPEPEPVAEPEPEPEPEPALPEVTLTGPATAETGAEFQVSWEPRLNSNDHVTIVLPDTPEGKFGNYLTTRDDTEGRLRAPAEAGAYQLRYVDRTTGTTLGRTTIEIVEPEVTVSGPESVVTGAAFEVQYTGAVDGNDYVTIVPMGTDEGKNGVYKVVRDAAAQTLTAPAEPGLYELRYVLREGTRTMARAPIEVTEPEITVSAPQSALAGADVRVSWTGAVSPNDYVTIVPIGTEEGKFGPYQTVRDATETDLRMPGDPGLYEVRYILREGGRTMASAPIEATMPEVTLEAPDQVRLGDSVRVGWSAAVNPQDYVNMVPVGSPDDKFGSYISVGERDQHDLRPVDTVGLYELRYMLKSDNRVIARRTIEVLPADAALETGASLVAPATAAPGTVIDVGWSVQSDSADQRITLAKADQAIFTWIAAVKIEGAPPVQITVPGEPGIYELRFLDLSGQQVLARHVLKVE